MKSSFFIKLISSISKSSIIDRISAIRHILLLISFGVLQISCEENINSTIKEDISFVKFPSGGETLIKGSTYQILWEDNVSETVSIKLYDGDFRILDIDNSAINNNYSGAIWRIPQSMPDGDNYYIKVFSNNNDFVSSQSASPFRIIGYSESSSFTDTRDGYCYKTVKIGEQWWMAENFRYDCGSQSVCYFEDSETYIEYGRLYTQNAAINNAPEGWHLPSDDEWKELEKYLGITMDEINKLGSRGKNQGSLITTSEGIGFNAKYAGYFYFGQFAGLGNSCIFWTSTQDPSSLDYFVRSLERNNSGVIRSKMKFYNFFSVRYVKD